MGFVFRNVAVVAALLFALHIASAYPLEKGDGKGGKGKGGKNLAEEESASLGAFKSAFADAQAEAETADFILTGQGREKRDVDEPAALQPADSESDSVALEKGDGKGGKGKGGKNLAEDESDSDALEKGDGKGGKGKGGKNLAEDENSSFDAFQSAFADAQAEAETADFVLAGQGREKRDADESAALLPADSESDSDELHKKPCTGNSEGGGTTNPDAESASMQRKKRKGKGRTTTTTEEPSKLESFFMDAELPSDNW